MFGVLLITSCMTHKKLPKVQEEFMLNGKITSNDLIKDIRFPWFQDNYKRYHPNDTAINLIKEFSIDLKVLIFMGTWCEDSKNEVPKFFKIAHALQFYDAQIEMIAVDRNKHCDSMDMSSYKIGLVPTFIFYKEGKEIGRIIETPHETLEKDLLKILNDAKIK